MFLGKCFYGIPIRNIPTHQTSPAKLPPGKLSHRKFSPGIFTHISLIAFLNLTLCFDKFSQT